MPAHTHQLHQAGVSLWLDNITRTLLDDGTLQRYINECNVTGLTSNPTIFDQAIGDSSAYDAAIQQKAQAGGNGEEIFFDLALEDLRRAADLFLPVCARTNGLDGWVSLEVSPLLAYDAASTLAEAKRLHALADRPNLLIKIPGTPEGLPAIEEAIFAGVPVNVTLLFSSEQYQAAADAWLRGVERRIEAGLNPDVRSVASVFISRWDKAAADKVPASMRNQLGVAVGKRTYHAYSEFLNSSRLQRAMNFGAQPQRLLWASTGVKDAALSPTFYADSLVAPYTINTLPEKTLLAYAQGGTPGELLGADGGDADAVIAAHEQAGISYPQLADDLQHEGADAFVKSWHGLLKTLAAKGTQRA
ncbi:transaldolase [Candidatus Thiothrix sp. Deng01]|uniref:Transaldolase n=1 Tax=Candidatus Thiothrix phosphatis TaxID=3112415 RepID=A0ABU6D2I7_9GAMM|nr:transaldolase [Candidatus Thiothrix sp. Deng01]MEB4593001.1 transaldolase [Candidatus Thiothrix sp. Deng01]